MHALVLTYPLADGTSGAEHAELCEQLAPAFAAVRGLVSKTWLANDDTGRYGAFYLFESRSAFDRFVASELFEMLRAHASIGDMAASDFEVNAHATAVTHGAVQAG